MSKKSANPGGYSPVKQPKMDSSMKTRMRSTKGGGGGGNTGEAFSTKVAHATKPALWRYNAIGDQADSTKPTEPCAAIALAPLPGMGQSNGVPGPGTYVKISTIGGKQVDSTMRTSRISGMAGREKFGSMVDVANAKDTPGPTDYMLKDCNKDKEPRAPAYSIYSRDAWAVKSQADKNPGPSDYGDISDAVAKTRPIVTRNMVVPAAQREQDPVYIGSRSENDVAPGEYDAGGATFDKQVSSVYRSAPKYSFSVGGRKHAPIGARMVTDETPPPTFKYNAIGKQSDSRYKSAPAATMSGRISFGDSTNVSELYTKLGGMNRLTTIRSWKGRR
jgi:hypothetical protein